MNIPALRYLLERGADPVFDGVLRIPDVDAHVRQVAEVEKLRKGELTGATTKVACNGVRGGRQLEVPHMFYFAFKRAKYKTQYASVGWLLLGA